MFKKLLVPLDGSPLAEQAVGQAAAIARACRADVELVLVHQPLPFAGFNDTPWSAARPNAEDAYLVRIVRELASGASVVATPTVLRGETVEMICTRAHDVDADLIVMTSHGRTGLSRAWLGSVADGVLRHSAIPVLVLRPVENKADRLAAHHLFKHVLVPLDGSALAGDILASAADLARCGGARITLLRIVPPVPMMSVDVDMAFTYPPIIQDEVATARLVEEETKRVDEQAQRLADETGMNVEAHVVVAGRVANAIVDFADGHGVDVIAMSTHGRGASRFLLGSIADKVLRAGEFPILLHRPVAVGENADAASESDADAAPPLPVDA
jgi:nucleotide-binding universal stress UspA family protein